MRGSKSRLVLTGATGFIGSKIVEECVRRETEVICLVRENLPSNSILHRFKNVDVVKVVFGEELPFRFSNNDVLLHLAWEYLDNYASTKHIEVLLPKHNQFLKICMNTGCKRVVGVGTCAEHDDLPLSDNRSSSERVAPNCYAVAKAALSAVTYGNCVDAGVEFAWARIWYVYGIEQRAKSLCGAIIAAEKRGEETFVPATPSEHHDFIHVRDVASKLVDLSLSSGVGTFEIGSGHFQSVFDFASRFVSDENLNIRIE